MRTHNDNGTPSKHSPADVCRVVAQLQAHHGWTLIRRDELVQRTKTRLQSGLARDATQAAIWIYSEVLYATCSGTEDGARRAQGYRELHRWLYDVAYVRYRDVAADATQQALELTHAGIDRCGEPGTFLMFALTQLCATACHLRVQFSAGNLVR